MVYVLPVKWALRDQAMGIDRPSDGHQLNKRRAFIAHAVCTECPKTGRFLGTPCRSAALLLCIMPHDDFVILRWRYLWYFYQIYDTSIRFMILLSDLWYFYDTSCKIFQNVSFFYLIIYQLFISAFSKRMILWHFFLQDSKNLQTLVDIDKRIAPLLWPRL